MRRAGRAGWAVALLLGLLAGPAAAVAPERLAGLLGRLEAKHGMDRARLEGWVRAARVRRDILDAVRRPAEREPWHVYRRRFAGQRLVRDGLDYWRRHHRWLGAAERRYGVPPEMVLAILGVETRYGAHVGRYPVLDALVTLSLHDVRRRRFFLKELEQLFLLVREEGLDPLRLRGSYAGALGVPQFIPSSYRHYGVDFDGDGRRDLMHSPADIIASVANYFHAHGWQAGAPVAVAATLRGRLPQGAGDDLKPRHGAGQWRRWGVVPAVGLDAGIPAALVRLEGKGGPLYHLGFNNFYVITRYNRSANYAMAVLELSRRLRAAWETARR